ncbi:MAG TPA: FtsX-like permease family protein [Humisphaera sp.]
MYKLLLILKYLRRRRIAWVSLAAVTLCTAMVIVVISVMGGWLRMFERTARGMTSDLVVKAPGMSGFPYYAEMVKEIEAVPDVEAAVPQIKTLGVINIIGRKTEGVEVYGVQIAQAGRVNSWPASLYRQHTAYAERGQTPPAQKTFDLRHVDGVVWEGDPRLFGKLDLLRPGERDLDGWRVVRVEPAPKPATGAATRPAAPPTPYDEAREALPPAGPTWANLYFEWPRYTHAMDDRPYLVFAGRMTTEQRDALLDAIDDKAWKAAIRQLASRSNQPGMIAGARVVEVGRDASGKIEGRDDWKYQRLWGKLTVVGVSENQELSDKNKAERTYSIVDDSRTGMWQYDNKAVYVPFDVLQRDLGMDEQEQQDARTGEKVVRPARATELNIRVRDGADLLRVRSAVVEAVDRVLDRHDTERFYRPRVETWREASKTYLDAIEKEKGLVVLLFGIISLVAVLLIFCIFYMIVAEKTRDIGIIKSVGATNGGVAGIFLGYGLTIGLLGAGLGLLAAWAVVSNINEIHDFMGQRLKLVVWNPEVYAFDTIPNHMNAGEVTVIMAVSVLAAVLGSLIPALRAAKMHPVEALRFE